MRTLFKSGWVRAGSALALLLTAINGYAGVQDQFEALPKLQDIVAVPYLGFLPWWGWMLVWLLVLQAVFVYALFEYVRSLIVSPKTVLPTPEPVKHEHRDAITLKLAGLVQSVCEKARNEPGLSWPLSETRTLGIQFREVVDSSHLIWTEDEAKRLRRVFHNTLRSVGYSMMEREELGRKVPISESLPAFEKATDDLVRELKG